MKILFYLLLPMVMIYIAVCLIKVDSNDRNNPFGTDSVKNNKYANGQVGEDFGVGTFWGKPDKKDSVRNGLDKIQWLSNTWNDDVVWRRSLVTGIVSSIIILLGVDPKMILNPGKLLFVCFTVCIIVYGTMSYYMRHFLWRRSKFINTHITKVKSKLKISLHNRVLSNPLI
jgi:hypothetical protein